MKMYEAPEIVDVTASSAERILESSTEQKQEEANDITINAGDLFNF